MALIWWKKRLNLYLGFEPNLIRKFEKPIYTHYITIGSCGYLLKVIGKNKAAAQPGVKEVFIKPRKGAIMMPPISMGHRYGYVIAIRRYSRRSKGKRSERGK